ncbi:MAG: hypothetical protein LBD17_06495 [Endomicrobium sp.]|jgi:hypothetical protein|nr:hypothetical protein [Endomicrobium sp.]
MKKIVNLLLPAVITFLVAVSIGAQGDLPEDTSEQWMRIIAMAPGGESIVKETATRAEELKRKIAAKRVEDKRRVASFLNRLYSGKFVDGIDDYFFGEIPQSDLLSEPKSIRKFLNHEIIVQSQKNNSNFQEFLEQAIYITLYLQENLGAEARETEN